MIRVVAKNFLVQEKINIAAPFYSELISATRKEEGCIEYRLFINSKVNTEYVFIEEWISQEALDKHMNSEHFKRLIPKIAECYSKPKDVIILEEFASK
jgi:quinol monooxygenase YgiN